MPMFRIPHIVLATLDYNLSNFLGDGIIRMGFDPYYSVFGNFTWGIILGIIGAGLYVNERSIGTVTIYLLLVGVFFSIVFPVALLFLFGLIFTLLVTIILYDAFIKRK